MSSRAEQTELLHHGGCLRNAAVRYGIALERWLDLSTGVNPNGWPVTTVPASAWARLPEDGDGLERAARHYYGAEPVLPVAGSQAAIQALPRLCPRSRVGVLDPGYGEHAAAWRRAGHDVTPVPAERLDETAAQADVLVIIHPNNPTGARFDVNQLLDWHARLAARNGWLLVDEAFMDITPEASLCRHSPRPGLIVLRSLGKFFGLPGARVGFVFAPAALLSDLKAVLGPWTLSTPARRVATAALEDRTWQQRARRRLGDDGARLQVLLTDYGLTPDGGCALFQWLRTPHASRLHEALACRGILTRLFAEPPSLRFGLPATQADWRRLETTLAVVTAELLGEAAR